MGFSLFGWLGKQAKSAEKLIKMVFDETEKDAQKILPFVQETKAFLGDVSEQQPSAVLSKALQYLQMSGVAIADIVKFKADNAGSLSPAIAAALSNFVAARQFPAWLQKGASYLNTVVQIAFRAAKLAA
jgi:hypothetical protein